LKVNSSTLGGNADEDESPGQPSLPFSLLPSICPFFPFFLPKCPPVFSTSPANSLVSSLLSPFEPACLRCAFLLTSSSSPASLVLPVPAFIGASVLQASLYDVPGGYRAVMFDRFSGVSDVVSPSNQRSGRRKRRRRKDLSSTSFLPPKRGPSPSSWLTFHFFQTGYRRGNSLPHPLAATSHPLRRSNQASGELLLSLPSPSSSLDRAHPIPSRPFSGTLLEHHHHHWIQGYAPIFSLSPP